jgi:hypothetical protein
MERIWVSEEIDLVIKAFEHEIKDDITQLFQVGDIFNRKIILNLLRNNFIILDHTYIQHIQ